MKCPPVPRLDGAGAVENRKRTKGAAVIRIRSGICGRYRHQLTGIRCQLARMVITSWASPGPQIRIRYRIGADLEQVALSEWQRNVARFCEDRGVGIKKIAIFSALPCR